MPQMTTARHLYRIAMVATERLKPPRTAEPDEESSRAPPEAIPGDALRPGTIVLPIGRSRASHGPRSFDLHPGNKRRTESTLTAAYWAQCQC